MTQLCDAGWSACDMVSSFGFVVVIPSVYLTFLSHAANLFGFVNS